LLVTDIAWGQSKPGPELAAAHLEAAGVWNTLRLALSESGSTRCLHRLEQNLSTTTKRVAVPASTQFSNHPFHNAVQLGSSLESLFHMVHRTAANGDFVATIGGDHSVAAATVSALAPLPGKLGVVWVDAHADFNTPQSTPSGNFHGMPLAALCGRFDLQSMPHFSWFRPFLDSSNVVIIGARAIDPGEASELQQAGVRIFSAADAKQSGMEAVISEAASLLVGNGCERIHLSFDIDALDACIVPGTGTPEPGGLVLQDALFLCAALHQSGLLSSMDLVEINPLLDPGGPAAPVEKPMDLQTPRAPRDSLTQTIGVAERILKAALLGQLS
jgi:arginase